MSEPKPKDQKKVFTKLSKNTKAPSMDKALISSVFSKQGNLVKSKRYFALFEDAIYYFNDEKDTVPKGYTQLDFGLRFEIIREKVDKDKQSPNKKKLARPKGIQFDRDGCQCEIYSNDEDTIVQWRDHLRGRINQRGFHELFRALRKIGKGNFASVYLAERLEDERMFAVKAFSKEVAFSQEKGKEALITEIELMRALDHPNIMKLHEVFETDNSLYFILDLLEGGQLYDKIKMKYNFSPDEIKSIMKGLVSGLAHMHERGIMHRDLKPENILFKKMNPNQCVIADLGLGTKYNLKEYLFVRCGTPGFVAPEVVNIKDMKTTYGPVCDIFSLGLIFHLLLVRKPPFAGKTYNDVLAQNRAGIVKLEGAEFLRVPNDAFDLLKKMLVKEPEGRINAEDAMNHKYFQDKPAHNDSLSTQEETKEDISVTDKQNIADLYQQQKESAQMRNLKQQITQTSQMQSPQLLPRKLPQNLEADSCVKFKMGQSPIMTGVIDDIGNKGGNSPGSVFIMNPVDQKNFLKIGMSPGAVAEKSAMSGLRGQNNKSNNDQIRKMLYMQAIDEKPEDGKDTDTNTKQEQKPKQQNANPALIMNKLKNL